MSDKLFPDEKNEYEYEEEDKNGFKQNLKNLIDKLENLVISEDSGRDEVGEAFRTESDSDRDYTSSTGFEIESSKKERSFREKAEIPTYAIIIIEIVLVTYLALALLGFVPMF